MKKSLTKEQLEKIHNLLDSIELNKNEEDSIYYDDLYYETIKNFKPIYEDQIDYFQPLPSFESVNKYRESLPPISEFIEILDNE